MDKVIEKEKWSTQKLATFGAGGGAVLLLAFLLFDSPTGSTLRVDPDRVTISRVSRGEFHEYIPIIGTIEPIKTVFMSAVEGGQVAQILVEDGAPISEGDVILRLNNADVQKESISTESRLFENLSQLRNTRMGLAEKALMLKEELLDTEYRISLLEKQLKRYQDIVKKDPRSISEQDMENVVDELAYRRGQKEIIEARIVQERTLREQQLAYVDATIDRVERNLAIIAETLENLEVRAPISGQLSIQRIEIGQNIRKGDTIGQIDILDAMKIRARVDQYYLAQVAVGQRGEFQFDNSTHVVEISKVYPDVADDRFEVDLEFVGAASPGLRRGQSVQVSLSLSDATTALLVKRGGFYNSTGGRWIYVLSEDGQGAHRKEIRVGRQNQQYFELLEGLDAGNRVITSSYDLFGTASQIEFDEAI